MIITCGTLTGPNPSSRVEMRGLEILQMWEGLIESRNQLPRSMFSIYSKGRPGSPTGRYLGGR